MATENERKTEIMNMIGYGLAKFDNDFVHEFGQQSKAAFGRYIVELGLADTTKAVSNRMDSFDPYFDNGRRGWFQRNQREHIKLFIDSLFGNEDAHGFATIVKLYIQDTNNSLQLTTDIISPAQKSRFKQLQETGKEAEFYFMNNYKAIPKFAMGTLEDARLWGDGYDFQIQCDTLYYLAEIKGLKTNKGSVRLTQNEYQKALEYKSDFVLVVISNMSNTPKLNYVENPLAHLSLSPREQTSTQINYYSDILTW